MNVPATVCRLSCLVEATPFMALTTPVEQLYTAKYGDEEAALRVRMRCCAWLVTSRVATAEFHSPRTCNAALCCVGSPC